MATPDELIALAPTLPYHNDGILRGPAKYLARGDRLGLETAHNLVTDAHNNLRARGAAVPALLVAYEMDLRQDRIEGYGSVGRQPDMTAPYWRRW
jgi:hypothetical protein